MYKYDGGIIRQFMSFANLNIPYNDVTYIYAFSISTIWQFCSQSAGSTTSFPLVNLTSTTPGIISETYIEQIIKWIVHFI